MASEVWKFRADPEYGWQEVMMPRGAEPIHYTGVNGGHLWAIVDPEAAEEPQRVAVLGTGWPIPDGARHVHTDMTLNGWVWHLFVPEDSTQGER